MNKVLVTTLALIIPIMINAQSKYSLFEIIELAQTQSPAYKQTETRKENRYWQYRRFRSNYNPQLGLFGRIPAYNRDFLSNRQDDGSIQFQNREQFNSFLNLGLEQPLVWTGGAVSINTNLNQFQDLNTELTRWSSTLVNVQLTQPIFGFNDLKWDKKTEPLRYEESKREYVESMELISRQAVDRYFNYLDAQIRLEIAEFNLANNDTIYNIQQGRYNIGSEGKEKLLQVELQLLRSKQDVEKARLDMQLTRLALSSFIARNNNEDYTLGLPENIPLFDVNVEEALQYAKDNRADFIAFERRRIEAEREVARAKKNRFQTDLTASFGLNGADNTFGSAYQDPVNQQRFNIQLDVPILTWGRNEASVQTALANKKLADYTIQQELQNFEQEIITLVSRITVLRDQIAISQKSNEVAQERYEVAQNRYLIGKVNITDLNLALEQKDEAVRSYVQSLKEFWIAFFDLRRLTLYDFENKELLYVD